jgi:glycosyltransferase involved in cell wall biosynthesis
MMTQELKMNENTDLKNFTGETLPRVVIIMSVYNAEKYLSEQIDSILAQRGAQVFIYIRDDGSCDRTPKILQDYARTDFRISFNRGANIGAMKSFMQALFDCPLKGDYFGFGDADDVWVPEKLEYTIGFIEKITRSHEAANCPVAVSTKLKVVNERLERIGETPTPKLQLCFENALVETVTSGASIVMNRSAYDLIREYYPKRAVMHDAWVYLLISAFGIFYYGDRPTILYRQHDSNVTGTAHGIKRRFTIRWRRTQSSNPYWTQAAEFAAFFRVRLEPRKRKILDDYLCYRNSFASRLRYALFPSVKAQSVKANLFYRILFLLGRG